MNSKTKNKQIPCAFGLYLNRKGKITGGDYFSYYISPEYGCTECWEKNYVKLFLTKEERDEFVSKIKLTYDDR
jgi:hypothetical protein